MELDIKAGRIRVIVDLSDHIKCECNGGIMCRIDMGHISRQPDDGLTRKIVKIRKGKRGVIRIEIEVKTKIFIRNILKVELEGSCCFQERK